MSVAQFGTLRHAAQIEAAAEKVIKDWISTYLAEIVAANEDGLISAAGIAAIPAPRSYSRLSSDFDRWPEDQLPNCVLVAEGTNERPTKNEEGYYSASYVLRTSVVCSARDESVTRLLASIYAAAVRGSILQRRSLEKSMLVTDWLRNGYGIADVEDRRSIGGEVDEFAVSLSGIVSTLFGPTETAPPYSTRYPYTATSVTPTVQPKES